MSRIAILLLLVILLLGIKIGGARADDGGTPTLTTADVTLTVSRFDAGMHAVALDSAGVASLLNAARCLCPTNVLVTVGVTRDVAATLGTETLEATLQVGDDCNDATAAACKTVGSTLTLSGQTLAPSQTVSTSDLFAAVVGQTSCKSLPHTSTRLWAIVRASGARTGAAPALVLDVGAAAPQAPSAVTATSADKALLVKWKAEGDTAKLIGFQVLCAPGPARPPDPAFTTACSEMASASTAVATDGGADDAAEVPATLAALDEAAICSPLVSAQATSVRVSGLDNGHSYQTAVVAIASDGTPSALSSIAAGTPGSTEGFEEIYRDSGGGAVGGCAVAGDDRRGDRWGPALAAVAAALAMRRRRHADHRPRRAACWGILVGASLLAVATPGRAGTLDLDEDVIALPAPAQHASPRRWNVELRFGPYRPAIDGEFAGPAAAVHPYAETFGDRRRLMSQFEFDRHLSHEGGTWAVGLGVGYFRVGAASLTADRQARSGDQTALRLVPLSLSLVYRADRLLQRSGLPFVPYVKTGLDCAFWSISETSKADDWTGRTWGWHAAAGLAMALDFLDPDASHNMDQEIGVNHSSLFVEVTHAALNGLGASNQLHVGDTTWMAGLMLEL